MKGRIQAEVGLLILPPQIQAVWGRLIKRLPGGPECLCQKPKGAGRGRVCLHRQLLQQARLPVHGQGGAGDDLPLFETVQRECVDPTGEKGQEYQLTGSAPANGIHPGGKSAGFAGVDPNSWEHVLEEC